MGVVSAVICAKCEPHETLGWKCVRDYLDAQNDVPGVIIGAAKAEQVLKDEGMRNALDGLQSDDRALVIGRIQAHDGAIVKTRLDDLAVFA